MVLEDDRNKSLIHFVTLSDVNLFSKWICRLYLGEENFIKVDDHLRGVWLNL